MKKLYFLVTVFSMLMLFVLPVASAEGPIEGRAGRAEVRFLEGMIDHHQMALDMAQDCLAKAQTESVLTKCQQIIDAQTAEIETMRGWLLSWYNIEYTPMPMNEHMGMMDMMGMMGDMPAQDMMDMMEGMDMSNMTMQDMMAHMMESSGGEAGGMEHGDHAAEGPVTDMAMMMGMMAGLSRLEGVEYEIAWLESMIDHHDDAIHMSERILQHEVHPETTELAQQIINDQRAEIEEMEGMIAELSAQ
jgi:uncharacterized protein (DUF305 family)